MYVRERDLKRKLELYRDNPDKYRSRKAVEYAKNGDVIKARVLAHYHANRDAIRKRRKELRQANKERDAAWNKASYGRRRAAILVQKHEYYCSHQEEIRDKNRRFGLKLYKLTPGQYDSMVDAQSGVCAICEEKQKPSTRRLCVDHDHTTGKVRGLLCDLCNHALERLENHNGWAVRAHAYLARSK